MWLWKLLPLILSGGSFSDSDSTFTCPYSTECSNEIFYSIPDFCLCTAFSTLLLFSVNFSPCSHQSTPPEHRNSIWLHLLPSPTFQPRNSPKGVGESQALSHSFLISQGLLNFTVWSLVSWIPLCHFCCCCYLSFYHCFHQSFSIFTSNGRP